MKKPDFAIFPIRADSVDPMREHLRERGVTTWDEEASEFNVVRFTVKGISEDEMARLAFSIPDEIWGKRGIITGDIS